MTIRYPYRRSPVQAMRDAIGNMEPGVTSRSIYLFSFGINDVFMSVFGPALCVTHYLDGWDDVRGLGTSS